MHEEAAARVYLLGLARRTAAVYAAIPQARAVMVTGSVAEEQCDFFSDLDMTVYYDQLPAEQAIDAARERNGGSERIWLLGDRGDSFAEGYRLGEVECQIGHTTVENWERDIATVREGLEVATPLHKALDGTLHCIPLYGEELLRGWQATIAQFPDALAEAMVRHYLDFFPLWYLRERFAARDATLWEQQIFVETGQNLLGVLAGLNRLYYTTFQFKRMRRFVAQMQAAPANFAARLDAPFQADRETAIDALEQLVAETTALVEAQMPQVDTSRVRRRLGQRQQRWRPVSKGG
jgi:hypothetical protein